VMDENDSHAKKQVIPMELIAFGIMINEND
jgi:hypothetical protein